MMKILKQRRRLIQAITGLPILLVSGNSVIAAQAPAGHPLPLAKHTGKVVLADFWASWCGPCRLSMPWLNHMSKKYADQGLQVIGVNLDERTIDAKIFLQEVSVDFEIVYDQKGEYANHYQLKAMPTSILFDRHGSNLGQHNGFLSDDTAKYEARIIAALKA